MTITTTASSTPSSEHPFRPTADAERPRHSVCERRLRLVLRLNAISSAIPGAIMAVAPDAVDDLLDTGRPDWVRIVGLALLPFAAFVAWLSVADTEHLRTLTPAIVAGDVLWVLASIATVAAGWYGGAGIAIVLAMAVIVDTWALLQWRGWRGVRTTR